MAKVLQGHAYCIFRVRDNLLYEVKEVVEMGGSEVPTCFRQVRDEMIIFSNDKHQSLVRLIQFEVCGRKFRVATNRRDLATLKIIILYVYRWQIELFFKYLKRTLKGLHLLNDSQNRVEIQFYLLMTLAILLLKFKQDCERKEKQSRRKKRAEKEEKKKKKEVSPAEWIKNISEIFYKSEGIRNFV